MRKNKNPCPSWSAGTGNEIISCGATRLDAYCVRSIRIRQYGGLCLRSARLRLAYSADAFPLALRSPFAKSYPYRDHTARGSLYRNQKCYSLFLNGLIFDCVYFSTWSKSVSTAFYMSCRTKNPADWRRLFSKNIKIIRSSRLPAPDKEVFQKTVKHLHWYNTVFLILETVNTVSLLIMV